MDIFPETYYDLISRYYLESLQQAELYEFFLGHLKLARLPSEVVRLC